MINPIAGSGALPLCKKDCVAACLSANQRNAVGELLTLLDGTAARRTNAKAGAHALHLKPSRMRCNMLGGYGGCAPQMLRSLGGCGWLVLVMVSLVAPLLATAQAPALNASLDWPALFDLDQLVHLHFEIEEQDYAAILADGSDLVWDTEVPTAMWAEQDGRDTRSLVSIRTKSSDVPGKVQGIPGGHYRRRTHHQSSHTSKVSTFVHAQNAFDHSYQSVLSVASSPQS